MPDATLDLPPLLAILRGVTPATIPDIAGALVAAGVGGIEVPLNSPDPFASVAWMSRHLPPGTLVGAGTVLSVGQVEEAAAAGARVIVSPNCDPAVVRRTKQLGLIAMPGIMTPTEAFMALDAGADALKIFPASIPGPGGIRALTAVLPPRVALYAVGGAEPDSFAAYLAAGCCGFGLGSYLFKPGWDAVTVRACAEAAVAAFRAATASDQ